MTTVGKNNRSQTNGLVYGGCKTVLSGFSHNGQYLSVVAVRGLIITIYCVLDHCGRGFLHVRSSFQREGNGFRSRKHYNRNHNKAANGPGLCAGIGKNDNGDNNRCWARQSTETMADKRKRHTEWRQMWQRMREVAASVLISIKVLRRNRWAYGHWISRAHLTIA